MAVADDAKFHYQSFSASYKLENCPPTFCNCEYCSIVYPKKYASEKIISKDTPVQCVNSKSNGTESSQEDDDLGKEKDYVDYHDLWQSERFRTMAFEKDNERLESRVKYLENKLEKETQDQIKISLAWRKTVMKLVDENTQLKLQIVSLNGA